jgi:acyl-CoA thioesterase I
MQRGGQWVRPAFVRNMDDHRICFVGDSFVNGTCDPDCLGWTGRLARDARANGFNLTVYNLGIRRETSLDIAARWLSECRCRLPDFCRPYVVFSFGVNDMTLDGGSVRVPEDLSIATARHIWQEAKALYPLLVIGPPPVADAEQNARVRRLSDQYQQVAQTENIPYLPVIESLLNEPDWMLEVAQNDGSHPGAWGYHRLASLVRNWSAWWFRPQPG